MNEVIVRMEMPDKCANCRAWCICGTLHKYMIGIDCDSDWTYDDLLVITDETGFVKPDDCPIICALPEGHGDLIDKDAFLRTVRPASKDDDAKVCTLTTVKRLITDHIRAQKTIVPATETEATPCP